jgi:excinuclease ABC subunit B
MYADKVTASMERAMSETTRRRGVQAAYNQEHGIDPQTIRKAVNDLLSLLRPSGKAPVPNSGARSRMRDRDVLQGLGELPSDQLERLIRTLEDEMHDAAGELRFEYAARLRDEIGDLKKKLRDLVPAD